MKGIIGFFCMFLLGCSGKECYVKVLPEALSHYKIEQLSEEGIKISWFLKKGEEVKYEPVSVFFMGEEFPFKQNQEGIYEIFIIQKGLILHNDPEREFGNIPPAIEPKHSLKKGEILMIYKEKSKKRFYKTVIITQDSKK